MNAHVNTWKSWLTIAVLAAGLFCQQLHAQVVSPNINYIVRTNFPVPVIGNDGLPTGQITNATKVVAYWYYVHANAGWDFMYRATDGDGIWLKPEQTANVREPGTGRQQKAIYLPFREDYMNGYELLPIITINPRGT